MNLPLPFIQFPILPLLYSYPNHNTAPEQQPTSPKPTHTSTPASEQTSATMKTSKSYQFPLPASTHYFSSISITKNLDTTKHSPTQWTESSKTSTFHPEVSSRETSTPTTHGGTLQPKDQYATKHSSKLLKQATLTF